MAFEDQLGAAAWRHPSAVRGSHELAMKAKDYIRVKAGNRWDAGSSELGDILSRIGVNNPGWSGSVGKEIGKVMAVFDEGNIAERMTHVDSFFIRVLAKDLADESVAVLEQRIAKARLNRPFLEKRRRKMIKEGHLRNDGKSAWDILSIPQQSPVGAQWHARARRSENSLESRSARRLADTGADMGPREEALHKAVNPDWNRDTDPVLWEEGTRYWIVNERDRWAQFHRDLSIPIGAGPSGTTNTFMQAAQALNVDCTETRTACIAYLLPAHHHTLVEVLEAAAPYGCPYTRGKKMYRDVRPFTEQELRACGRNGLFPDENSAATA
jgi:hypothetical protein